VNASIIAVGGWLEHCVGLARPAYPDEIVPDVEEPQYHLSDGCHREEFIIKMYVYLCTIHALIFVLQRPVSLQLANSQG
jgi:hypothetical protein